MYTSMIVDKTTEAITEVSALGCSSYPYMESLAPFLTRYGENTTQPETVSVLSFQYVVASGSLHTPIPCFTSVCTHTGGLLYSAAH